MLHTGVCGDSDFACSSSLFLELLWLERRLRKDFILRSEPRRRWRLEGDSRSDGGVLSPFRKTPKSSTNEHMVLGGVMVSFLGVSLPTALRESACSNALDKQIVLRRSPITGHVVVGRIETRETLFGPDGQAMECHAGSAALMVPRVRSRTEDEEA
jgi:hypothetical protein